MVTSRWTAAPAQAASLRRRGAVLERAILDAALEQLSTVGWNGLTMEGVAAGAQTGKAAVYRRWPSKEDLVADALQAGLPRIEEAPDLGSVGLVVGATVGSAVADLGLDLAGCRGPLLAPGVGAQGAGPAELRAVFGAARGQVLASSSREVLGAGPSATALAAAAERTRDAVLAALA